uniref:Uncharacterized protein n=1 Tax=Meloidogyne enterolobii TaxID=390850 RepID=A0A6V7XQZ0_MELEN|nr:unnamed protein product [Meloidogyne enterolobii]
MKYINLILFLRVVNILLIICLLLQLSNILDQISRWREYWEIKRVEKQENYDKKILSDQPLYTPNPAGTLELESIRLNELFARPTHKCLDRRTLGGYRDSFFVCFDEDMGIQNEKLENGLSINGQKITKENENFEISLYITSWTLLLPQKNNLVENLQNNVFIQYMPELEEEGHFPEDRIAAMLDNDNQIFNLAKIDLDTELLSEKRKETKVRIELLNWILRILRTKQLLIVLRPGLDNSSLEDENGNVLLLWYRFIYSLFFQWKYALLGARSNSRCGQALQKFDPRHCEWRLSFVHFEDLWSANDVPAYGAGSPLEEKLRFLRYLLSHQTLPQSSLCSYNSLNNNNNNFLPFPICQEIIKEQPLFNLFVYFRYKYFSNEELNQLENLLELTEEMAIFYPEVFKGENSIFKNKKLTFFNQGISHYLNKSMRMPLNIRDNSTNSTIYLNLNPFNDLLKEIQLFPYKRNILFFDIDGAEWDIFGVILNKTFCDKWLRSFKQICLKNKV